MPNVTGTFVDDSGKPIAATTVEVWQYNLLHGLVLIKSGQTDSSGAFQIALSLLDTIAIGEFQVRLKSDVGRIIWKSPTQSVLISDLNLNTVTIPATALAGWPITNLDSAGTQARLTKANNASVFVDAHDAWKDLEDRIKGTQSELLCQLFYFDVGNDFLTFTPDPPVLHVAPTGRVGDSLEGVIVDVNTRTPAVSARVLIRDAFFHRFFLSPDIPYPGDTDAEVKKFFSDPNVVNTVKVRTFGTQVYTPFHAKFAVIDGKEATIIGSPILQEYYDTQVHSIDEPRRGVMSSLKTTGPGLKAEKNSIRSPVHDVGVRLIGEAAADLRDTFFLSWDAVPGTTPEGTPSQKVPADTPNVPVQIARTLPAATYSTLPDGETGILEAYQRAFLEATDFVYVENQYLLSDLVVDSIRLALQRSKKRGTNLQFIIVINFALDLFGYTGWQTTRLRKLLDGLAADNLDDRVGVFSVWSHEAGVPKDRVIRTYVHSKVAFADDLWATIGSANLDGTSMNMTDYTFGAVRAANEGARSVEVNALMFNGVNGLPSSDIPKLLRKTLWAEMLGLSSLDPVLDTRPADGWLSLWKTKAEEKRAGLAAVPATGVPCRVLSWEPFDNPTDYLTALSISKLERFDLLKEVQSFDFTTGEFK